MDATHADTTLTGLPASAPRYQLVKATLVAAAITVVVCVLVVWFGLPVPVPAVALVAGTILAIDLAFVPVRCRYYRYRVTPDEVHVSRGRFLHATATVAVPQILHAEVSQGPLLRAFGLAEVRVKMIVGGHDLGPVTPAEAERIRRTILAAADSAVVDA